MQYQKYVAEEKKGFYKALLKAEHKKLAGQLGKAEMHCWEALGALGRVSHCWQDFYGHTGHIPQEGDDPLEYFKDHTDEPPGDWNVLPLEYPDSDEHPQTGEPDFSSEEEKARKTQARQYTREKFSKYLGMWADSCQCVVCTSYEEDDGWFFWPR